VRGIAFVLSVLATVPAAERFPTLADCEKSCAWPRQCVETKNKIAICGAPCAWDTDCDHGQTCKCVPGLERECARSENREDLRMCMDVRTNVCEVITIGITPLERRQRDEILRFVNNLDFKCKATFNGVVCEYGEPLDTCGIDARVIDELLNVADLPAQVRCGSIRRC
jgi:hypothetical protein